MVICLERGADLHMAQLMPLPLTVSCSNKIQIGVTFLVPTHLGSPGQRVVKRVCVCVHAYALATTSFLDHGTTIVGRDFAVTQPSAALCSIRMGW